MIMSGELQAIKTSFEQEGLTPEQIAIDRDLDPAAVKAALCQCSSLYRREAGQEGVEDTTLNFSDDELRRVNEKLVSLALCAEDENVQLRAAMYVRDDKKGRKEVIKAIANNTFNVLNFNEIQRSAREGAKRITEQFRNKSITV
jgi:hypothetical protein